MKSIFCIIKKRHAMYILIIVIGVISSASLWLMGNAIAGMEVTDMTFFAACVICMVSTAGFVYLRWSDRYTIPVSIMESGFKKWLKSTVRNMPPDMVQGLISISIVYLASVSFGFDARFHHVVMGTTAMFLITHSCLLRPSFNFMKRGRQGS